MWNYIKEHVRPFWVGFTGSGIVWGNILFADPPTVSGPVLAYILKLVGAACIAFASGLAACAANDYYKWAKPLAITTVSRIRERIRKIFKRVKHKKDDRQKDESEAA
jgi:hypothetical protein